VVCILGWGAADAEWNVAMPVVEWNDDLSVGVAALDRDHKRLIGYLNQLAEAVGNGHSVRVMGGVLRKLSDYTNAHFAAEEALMAEAGYPGLEAHRAMHQILAEEVRRFHREYKVDPRPFVAAELVDFLRDWLVGHILTVDMLYRPALAHTRAAEKTARRSRVSSREPTLCS